MEINKYLTTITMILIEGIDNEMLELTVLPLNAKNPNDQVSICNIFLSNTWCLQVETTDTGKNLTSHNERTDLHHPAMAWWKPSSIVHRILDKKQCVYAQKRAPSSTLHWCYQKMGAMQTYAQSLIQKYHVSPYNPTKHLIKNKQNPQHLPNVLWNLLMMTNSSLPSWPRKMQRNKTQKPS